jgi:hypothetical protein
MKNIFISFIKWFLYTPEQRREIARKAGIKTRLNYFYKDILKYNNVKINKENIEFLNDSQDLDLAIHVLKSTKDL